MSDTIQTLFGFPVVVTDAVTEGEVLLGRLPTMEEVHQYGSLEAAIEAQKMMWVKIKNLSTDDQ